ncbi:MAG: hypothetical protein WKF81_10440 [Thermomicrobiales bacterium]
MAAPIAPDTRGTRRLAILEQERKTESDSRAAIWVFVWTLFAFKIATVAVIFFAARGTHEAQAIILATTWFWFLIPVAAIAGPTMYWKRLRRMRRRREELRHAEWNVNERVSPANRVIVVQPDDDPTLA